MSHKHKQLTWSIFVALLKQHITGESAAISSTQLAKIDTPFFLNLLKEHRLELTLYPLFKPALPLESSLAIELAKRCQVLMRQHLKQQQLILKIAKIFSEHGILHVFLKGSVLNQQLYGSKTTRYSRDIDVLIALADLNKAKQALQKLKIEPNPDFISIETFETLPAYYQAQLKDFIYTDTHTHTPVELHIRTHLNRHHAHLMPDSKLATVTLMNQNIPVLLPEKNFLYLVMHAAKHEWLRLQWLTDLAVFYQRIPLDWDLLCEYAKLYSLNRSLFATKRLLQECFGITLPDVPYSWQDKFFTSIHIYFVKSAWRQTPSLFSAWRSFLFKCRHHLCLLVCHFTTWQDRWVHVFSWLLGSKVLKLKPLLLWSGKMLQAGRKS